MNVLVQSVSTQAGVSSFETVRETRKLGCIHFGVMIILGLDLCDSWLGLHMRGHNSVGPFSGTSS